MPYKACYNCELLFEVDSAAAEMSCTECGDALVDYAPDASELEQLHDEAAEGETIMLAADQVASPVSSGVVATMAIEGLAAKLRAAAEQGQGADAILPARRVEPPMMSQPKTEPLRITDPSPRSVQPVQAQPVQAQPVHAQPAQAKPIGGAADNRPTFESGQSRATKMLDVSALDPAEWGAQDAPGPDLPAPALPGPALPGPALPGPALPAMEPINTPSMQHPSRVQSGQMQPIGQTPRGVPAQAGFATRRQKKKKGKAGLLIAIVVFIGAAGGGVAAWYLTKDKGSQPQPASVPSAAPPQTFDGTLTQTLKDASVRLPKVSHAEALPEIPYLVGGMEGLVFSAGQVPGLASARLTSSVIGTEDGHEFVRPVRAAFERVGLSNGSMGFAFDRKLAARDVLRFALSAQLAGAGTTGFVVVQGEGFGRVNFSLQIGALGEIPDGVLVVRVGKLGFHVTVKDAAGTVISAGEPSIGLRDDRGLDLNALGARLDELVNAHAAVRTGVVYPSAEMPHEDLVAIIARLVRGAEGPRFPDVRIALP